MSKFHSIVSRRDFMKALGLTGAGLGAAALTAPVYHDLDELIANPGVNTGNPWWVKTRDLGNPTIEIDWSLVKPYAATRMTFFPQNYFSDSELKQLNDQGAANKLQWMKDKKPGFTLRDQALADNVTADVPYHGDWVATADKFTNYVTQGVPKWQGTPEENSRMVRAVLKFWGASLVGFTAFDQNVKKLVFNPGVFYGDFAFENVSTAYTKQDGTQVIPNNIPTMAVEFSVPIGREFAARGPGVSFSRASDESANRPASAAVICFQRFMGTLGYQPMGMLGVPNPALEALNGNGEIARDAGQSLNPHFGMFSVQRTVLTDIQLAPSNPIDAGIFRFCQTCAKCADVCPSGCLTTDPPSWEPAGGWTNTGKKAFQNTMINCEKQALLANLGCNVCMNACVFTKGSGAVIHDVVKAAIASSSAFNGFFKKMDDMFGYGQVYGKGNDPLSGNFNPAAADWWDLNLPTLGYDGSILKGTSVKA